MGRRGSAGFRQSASELSPRSLFSVTSGRFVSVPFLWSSFHSVRRSFLQLVRRAYALSTIYRHFRILPCEGRSHDKAINTTVGDDLEWECLIHSPKMVLVSATCRVLLLAVTETLVTCPPVQQNPCIITHQDDMSLNSGDEGVPTCNSVKYLAHHNKSKTVE